MPLLLPQLLYSQTWVSDSFNIAVLGHVSSACNPKVGDAVNMERCSIKVRITRKDQTSVDVVLPWETASVQNSVAIDAKTFLFIGATQAGYQQITVYSDASKSIVYKRLSKRASLSPTHDLVAFETYQPPHGSEIQRVQIEVVPTRDLKFNRAWKSKIVFGSVLNSNSKVDSAERGEYLCSGDLFWSRDESRIGFCTNNMDSGFEHLVLVSPYLIGETAIFKQIDTKSICRHMEQRPNERCTVFVEQMSIGADAVDVLLRSAGSNGYKEEQVSYQFKSFGKS
jgi:hypothetical protein